MNRGVCAICDSDSFYVSSFINYFKEKNAGLFQMEAFTNEETLLEYTRLKQVIDLLLISELLLSDSIENLNIKNIIILSEEKSVKRQEQYPVIYKYQSISCINKEIINIWECNSENKEHIYYLPGSKQLIGIYSPVSNIYKTSLALTLGQVMSKSQKVLYVNMEDYSGLPFLLDTEYEMDLSDILYLMEQEKKNMQVLLQKAVCTLNGLDYIPPVRTPMDICQTGEETWITFLQEVINASAYDAFILDLGSSIKNILSILRICTLILIPFRDDICSQAKIKHFENVVHAKGYSGIMPKTRKLNFSNLHLREVKPDQLIYSELGEIARNIKRKEIAAGEIRDE